MELHIALKEIVVKWGDEIITDETRLKRLLASKKTYSEKPELREIVRYAIEIGYFNRIYMACQTLDWEDEIPQIENEFNEISSPMGFDVDDVHYVFGCIPFSLGLTDIDDDLYEEDDDIDGQDDFIDEDLYTITKQYHENKGIDIFVVRLKNRVDSDTFSVYKAIAKKHGKGFYSTYRGVNGFVFYSIEDAKEFAEEILKNEISVDNGDLTNLFPQSQTKRENEANKKNNSSRNPNSQIQDLCNMDLHLALRNIIDTDGVDIINDVRIVNILSDFKVFDAIPASKYILRAIVADGYARRLASCGKWDVNAEALCSRFVSSTGFQEDYVSLIFQSLAYGLRFINKIDSIRSALTQPRNSSNAAQVSSVNLNLSQSELNRKNEKYIQNYKENVEHYLDSIIEIKGDVKKEIGADISVSSEYDTGDNSFRINIEITGPVRYKFENEYSTGISFNIVLYNTNSKLISKAYAYIDKDSFKKSYQVLTSDWFLSKQFRHIADIKKLIVYWNE